MDSSFERSRGRKKNTETELEVLYPSLFDRTAAIDYYARLKKLALAEIDAIISETENNAEVVKELSRDIAAFVRPRNFAGKDSVEVRFERDYEQMCVLISSELNMDAKALTVKEYYAAYMFLDERSRRIKEAERKRGR